MTFKSRYSHSVGTSSGPLTRPSNGLRPPKPSTQEPRQPDWLMILMVSLFVLTLMIAWLVDIPALLR